MNEQKGGFEVFTSIFSVYFLIEFEEVGDFISSFWFCFQ